MTEDPRTSPVHYPSDRRVRIRIRPALLFLFVGIGIVPMAAAVVQYLLAGLPVTSHLPPASGEITTAHSLPIWLRLAHFVNFLFLVLLARSGLSILMDHPRLYWNDHCTPETAWLKFTPLDVPTDRVWTAKDDARYISPWVGLPGYRHTIAVARHWHLIGALFWFLNGAVFVVLLCCTDEWKRLVPSSWSVVAEAWKVFVHHATLHLPPESDPLVRYNALQQLGYFVVVFVMAPLSVLTGLAMSPAIDNRFLWYPKLFGGRQAARSIHLLLLTGYVLFLVMHVTMVFLNDPIGNMNAIVFGSDDGRPLGLIVGLAAIGLVAVICFLAHWISWHRPRALQYAVWWLHAVMRWLVFKRWQPCACYSKEEISPFLWPNGKLPTTEEWESLVASGFVDYRLKVFGLVENPIELSLAEMATLGKQEQITMHHCIQGWSGIAQWGGLPLAKLIELVKPHPDAMVVVFHSFGEGLYGGEYYDTQPLEVAMQTDTLLAYEMNFEPLSPRYGAPLRLRVEGQLGYKMVKWIKSVEFVASEREIGKGYGGKNEDDEYFDLMPEI